MNRWSIASPGLWFLLAGCASVDGPGVPDTGVDAPVDGSTDSTWDPDTTSDPLPETVPDVPPDTTSDLWPDTPPDTVGDPVLDTAVDTETDPVTDLPVDTTTDPPVDSSVDTSVDPAPDTISDTVVDVDADGGGPTGSTCHDPVDLTSVTTWTGSYSSYGDLWGGGSGCGYATGPEVWFSAVVQDGHLFRIEETSGVNVTIQEVSHCGTTLCTGNATSPEQMSYLNDTGAPVTVHYVVEAYSSSETGTITVVARNGPVPSGFGCTDPIDVSTDTIWTGAYTDFDDLWDGSTGCGSASGPEVWFTATVPDGYVFTIEETSSVNVTIQVLDSCSTLVCSGYESSPERGLFFNDTGAPVTVLHAVEAYYSTEVGTITVATSLGPAPRGYTCDDPIDLDTIATPFSADFPDFADLWDGSTGCGSASGPEVWFTATVAPGNVFTIEETSSVNVTVQQVSACGGLTCEDYGSSPEQLGFFNDTASDVTLLFAVEAYYSTESGTFTIEADNSVPPEGFSCSTAVDVGTLSGPWSGSYSDYMDLWDGSTGCGSAYGPEVWFTATVADGEVFRLRETSSTNVTVQQVESCGEITCTAYGSSPEELSWYNDTGGTVTSTYAVEAYSSSETAGLTVEAESSVPPTGYTCVDAIDVSSLTGPWTGSLADYADMWDGSTGCGTAYGREVWFTATVPAGNVFTIEETSTTNVTIQRTGSCTTAYCDGYASSPELYSWYNDTGFAATIYLVVEGYSSTDTGSITVEAFNAPPPEGYTCLDAIDTASLSGAWTGDFGDYGDLWDGVSGCGTAYGADVWFAATVNAGDLFTIEETGTTNVTVQMLTACGTTTCEAYGSSPEIVKFYNDSASPVSLLFVVEAYNSTETGGLTVETTNGHPPEGYSCESAVDVSTSTVWTGSFGDYDDLWDSGGGCGTAYGPDVWFTATVDAGNIFTIQETGATNVTLQRVSGCGFTSCVDYASSPEGLSYYNDTGAPYDLLFAVEAYSSTETGSMTVDVTSDPAPDGYVCPSAIDVSALTSWSGDLGDYADFWSGGSSCGSATGNEIWFEATVPSGNTFTMTETSSMDVILQRLATCSDVSCEIWADTPETISYGNTTGSDVVLHMAVEGRSATTGTITLEITNTP